MNNVVYQADNSLCTRVDPVTAGVKRDLELWKQDLLLNDLSSKFLALRKPKIILGVAFFVIDWVIIFFAFYLCFNYPVLAPICLLIAGSKQRGLSNLIHDSSHFNLTRNRKINDLISNLMGGLPMISPVKNYRISHLLHHRHLGHSTLDPDSKMHQRYKYNDLKPPYNSWFRNVLYLIFNFQSWKDSNIGSWVEITKKQKCIVLFWWVTFTLLIALFSIDFAISFICFWQLTRATGYHFVRTIAEFLDHSGLPIGSIVENSRIVTTPSWFFKKLFHPHNDNFHALHHFDPALPNYKLPQAHILVQNKSFRYSKIKRNNGYFFGNDAAIKDLVGVL